MNIPSQPNNGKTALEKKVEKAGGQAPLRQGFEGQAWWQPALMLFARLSVWIAGPVIIAVFVGKWLDQKYNSAPWLFLGCVGAAFFISMIGLIKNTIQEYKKIEKNIIKDKNKQK